MSGKAKKPNPRDKSQAKAQKNVYFAFLFLHCLVQV